MDFVVWVSCVLVEVKDVEIDAFAVKKKKKVMRLRDNSVVWKVTKYKYNLNSTRSQKTCNTATYPHDKQNCV